MSNYYCDHLMMLDHIENILDYYVDIHYRNKSKEYNSLLTQGSSILEGLVHEDPFVIAKAYKAAKLYIARFNSQELH